MRLFKLKSCDYSNRFLKSINSRCPCICQSKIFTNLTNYKMVKKSSMQLFGYQILKDIQMKFCQQKIVERVLRVCQNPKRNNVIR